MATCLDISEHKFKSENSSKLLAVALSIQGEILVVDANTLTEKEPKGIILFL